MTEENKAMNEKKPSLSVMSPKEYENLKKNIIKNMKAGCLFCSSTDFNIPKEKFLIQIAQENGMSIPSPSMPVFFLQCTNCGFTYTFSPQFVKSEEDTK